MPQLNVAQLIEKLQAVEDKTLPVSLDGCDCIQECSGAVEQEKVGQFPAIVLLTNTLNEQRL